MAGRVSGKRYAQAIFELAREQDQIDQWATELELVDQVVQDPEFRVFLNHADVPHEQKRQSIDAVLRDVHPTVRNLVQVLVARGLADLAIGLRDAYTELLDVHHGRQRVGVTSAVPLEDDQLARITQFISDITRREVVISTQVDESIMGGIVIQIGDQLLDGSTRSRLEALRNQMHSAVIGPGFSAGQEGETNGD